MQDETKTKTQLPDGLNRLRANDKLEQAVQATELSRNEARLKLALKAASMVTWEWDIPAGMIHYSTNTPEIARGEAIEPYCSIKGLIQEVHPDDRAALTQAIQRTISEGVAYECEYRVKMLDGVYRWILGKGDVVEQRDGKPVWAMGISQDITQQKKIQGELNESLEKLKNLTRHLQSVREQERIIIARGLHDELGQVLTAINLEVSAISRKLPQSQQDLKSRAEITTELAVSAIKSLKRIISELRPTLLDDLGLAEAIRWHVREYQGRCRINFDVSITPDDFSLDDNLSIAIFRIFQESITNAVRHSNAKRISVNLKQTDTEIVLKIKDNGIGIRKDQLSQSGSFGIMGMKERAEILGGAVDISGIPGKGTTLVARFPWHPAPVPSSF